MLCVIDKLVQQIDLWWQKVFVWEHITGDGILGAFQSAHEEPITVFLAGLRNWLRLLPMHASPCLVNIIDWSICCICNAIYADELCTCEKSILPLALNRSRRQHLVSLIAFYCRSLFMLLLMPTQGGGVEESRSKPPTAHFSAQEIRHSILDHPFTWLDKGLDILEYRCSRCIRSAQRALN